MYTQRNVSAPYSQKDLAHVCIQQFSLQVSERADKNEQREDCCVMGLVSQL